jgi:hypothetical protein
VNQTQTQASTTEQNAHALGHPVRETVAFRDLPPRAPDSDKVEPTLLLGGANAPRFASVAALVQELRERVGRRRIDLRFAGFSHPLAQGAGVNVWAVGPQGREWIGTAAGRGVTAAGRGVTIAALGPLLSPSRAVAA